jgi:uncharacterized membrane protein
LLGVTTGWLYDTALCFHLLGAFSLVSGSVVAAVGFETARRRSDCAQIAALLAVARVGATFVIVGTVLAAAFGLWLVDLGRWGYGSAWVDSAIAILVVVVVIGAIGAQGPKSARKLAATLSAQNRPLSKELRELLDNRVSIALNYLAGAALLVIVVLMVTKPGSAHP